MKKSALLLSMCLSVGLLFGALSPAASAEQAQKVTTQSKDDFSTMVNTGWIKKGGIEARVYTDRTSDYPSNDTYIGVTGEKTSAGGTVYYAIHLLRVKANGDYEFADKVYGSLSSKTPQAKFYIDNYLSKGKSGKFAVMMKLFKDKEYDQWIGDWITASFTVNH